MDWETWGPPLVVLGAGVLVGLVVALRARAGGAGSEVGEDLAARKNKLLEQLASLEADRGKLADAEWAARREALLTEAARAMKAEEQAAGRPVPAAATAAEVGPTPAAPTPVAGRPAGRTGARLAWAGGAVIFFAVLGYVLVQYSAPRGSGSITGGMGGGGSSTSAAPAPSTMPSAAVAAAQKQLEADPTDLGALNLVTHAAIADRDLASAMQYLDRARAVGPEDAEVLTHLAVLQVAVGFADRAEAGLDKALAVDPNLVEALLWKAVVLDQRGDAAGAREYAKRAADLAGHPEELAAAQGLLAQLDGGGAAMSAPTPPVSSGGSASTSSGAPLASGTVSLADGVSPLPGATLFIYARRTAQPAGPPAAAKKIGSPSFPLQFTLTDGDMPMGGPWPDQVWFQARLDADGNAMTKGADDLQSAVLGPVSGTAPGELSLVLGGG